MIKYYLTLFNTRPTIVKVPAHTSDPKYINNQLADRLAKQALFNYSSKPTPLTLPPIVANNIEFNNIYHNGNLVEVYPSKFIKNLFRKKEKEKNNESLVRNIKKTFFYNQEIAIEIEIIKKIICSAAPRMDPSRVKDLKFRMQTINNRLATGKLLHSYNSKLSNKCPYCNKVEDIPHLWSCQNTINLYPQLILETKLIMIKRFPKISLDILNLLQMENPEFLNLHLSCGIITTEDLDMLKTIVKDNDRHQNIEIKDIFIKSLDCFLSAFFNLIWKPRCEVYYNPDLERTFPITAIQRHIQLLNLIHTPLFPPVEIDPHNIDVYHLLNDPIFPPVTITEENYHLFAPPMN